MLHSKNIYYKTDNVKVDCKMISQISITNIDSTG